ncbi:MAG: YraN family protein [Planctomycetes bacterium]|nr:YraN family protein [Planctomycetota bacterium]
MASREPGPGGTDARSLGRAGEEAAARFLAKEGWTLLERNARTPAGEIDLVLERGGVMGFVEVKARRGRSAGSPEEAVDREKADRVARAAEEYLSRRRLQGARRTLLVAAVDMDPAGNPVLVRVLPLEDGSLPPGAGTTPP